MARHHRDPELELLEGFFKRYDALTVRFSVLMVCTLFLVGLTLFIVGAGYLVKSWIMMAGRAGLISLRIEGDLLTSIIEGLGGIAIGYAVFDLSRSILREEIAEERTMDVQKRARDFVTRVLSVIVVAMSIEVFINEAKFSASDPSHLWQVAAISLSVGVLLVGWGVYVKLSRR